jgi:hypothetical protein
MPDSVMTRAPENATERQALSFTTAILCACLFLQRFGVPVGGQSISLVGPIGLALAGLGVLTGTLAFDARRLIAFLALTALAVLGLIWTSGAPNGFENPARLQSTAQFLLLSSFAVFSFATPVDERHFFERVNFWLAVIAACGIAQFAAQFVGLGLFAFTGLLPDAVLYESAYNLQIPIGFAGLFKANGFFLVEPSVFSQFMALGLIIEILSDRRLKYLVLFSAGLLLSVSGTGWIVLGSFVVAAAVAMGLRGLAIAAGTVIVAAAAGLAVVQFAPDLADAFGERLGEISQMGTSGHLRFITPFWLLDDILARAPAAALVGIGGGGSERVTMPYEYNVNTPIKVALEYGFPALVAYLSLFVMGSRTSVQAGLVAPAIVLFLFTGGYQQFPPVLFVILLLIAVARLRPSEQHPGDPPEGAA